MKTFIALLRGINVSGQKKILMADLRESMKAIGFRDVTTYIQSGNIIFSSDLNSESHIADKIMKAVQQDFGFEVPVLVIRPSVIVDMLDSCPFNSPRKENSYFTLLFKKPDPSAVAELEAIHFEGEELVIKGRYVFFHSTIGYGRSKLSNNLVERKLKVKATARNYRTMMKLLSLCNQKTSHD